MCKTDHENSIDGIWRNDRPHSERHNERIHVDIRMRAKQVHRQGCPVDTETHDGIHFRKRLTAALSDQLESIQQRAFRIIFGDSSFANQSYERFCSNLEILPLSARRVQRATCFFFINS